MRLAYWIIIFVLVAFSAYTILRHGQLDPFYASGDDGSGCESPLGTYGAWQSGCYSGLIYHQNQQIIQLEEQNARIGALDVCISSTAHDAISPYGFKASSHDIFVAEPDMNSLNQCEQKVLNDTK